MLKYLKYSNVYITINLNPLHWAWKPYACEFNNTEWPGTEREYRAVWLGVLVKVIIDNGEW